MKHFLLAAAAFMLACPVFAQKGEYRDSVVVKPWGIVKNTALSTGTSCSLSEADLEHYPAADLRNRLVGLIPGLEITESSGSLHAYNYGIGASGSGIVNMWSRGLACVCIVDDVAVPFEFFDFDPEQIESVTYLNHVTDKALFGPVASNGALYITTKKGGFNTPTRITANIESGVGVVDLWPEWVDGVDYMTLNNTARGNAGYQKLYSDFDIVGTLNGSGANDLKYPDVDYKSLLYRNFKPITRFGFNAQGGSSSTKFNLSLTGLNDNFIDKLPQPVDFNRLNVNTYVTTRLGQYVMASVGAIGMTSFQRGLNGLSFTSYSSVPATAHPVYLMEESDTDIELKDVKTYAVSRTFNSNPYASAVEGGQSTIKNITGLINLNLDVDLSFLLPGLKSRTFADVFSNFYQNIGKSNDFFAYYWERDAETYERSTHVTTRKSKNSVTSSNSYQSWQFLERLSYEKAWDRSSIDAGVTYYMSSTDCGGNAYYERMQNVIGNISWNYDNKFFADVVVDYSGCTCFEQGNRFAVLPTAALAWRPSEKLKIYAQSGLIGANHLQGSHYLYNGLYQLVDGVTFGQAGSNPWFGNTTQTTYDYTTISRMANPDLSWNTMWESELGAVISPVSGLEIAVDGYCRTNEDIITETASEYPELIGMTGTYYENYNKTIMYGADLSVRYRKSFGDFRLGAMASGSWYQWKYDTYANDIYEYEWQKITGTRGNAIRGYEYVGKFTSEEEIATSARVGNTTQVGDLKYKDLNNDGTIDNSDIKIIGYSDPALRYSVCLDLGWKNFDVRVVGSGRAFYDISMTNGYFFSGWGDGNYTAFVRDNIGGDYPRLSYVQATDNFVGSAFWLRKGGYFKIQNVELAYNWDFNRTKGIKGMRASLRGSNLCTLTKVKYVDPENINLGVSAVPLFTTITAGLKFNF